MQDYHIVHTTLCRRIAVRECREHKAAWRTGTVDHFSECFVKQATTSTWTTVCDDLSTLHKLIMTYMKNGKEPQMWKQDIASAYRKVPLKVEEAAEFCGVVFSHQGKLYVSYHKAASFGAMSSVQSWHRVASLLAAITRQFFLVPVCRSVDDFFGPMAKQAQVSVCDIFTTVCSCLGFPTEEAKKEQWKSVMTVLGADVAIAWERRCARYSVSKDKAVRWRTDLKQALQEGTLTPDRAEKYAGRLGFATNVMGDKDGRAFIKPFFMQAYCPTYNFIMSPLLKEALMWRIEYLRSCQPSRGT